jgi:hypothetical protein
VKKKKTSLDLRLVLLPRRKLHTVVLCLAFTRRDRQTPALLLFAVFGAIRSPFPAPCVVKRRARRVMSDPHTGII